FAPADSVAQSNRPVVDRQHDRPLRDEWDHDTPARARTPQAAASNGRNRLAGGGNEQRKARHGAFHGVELRGGGPSEGGGLVGGGIPAALAAACAPARLC